MPLERGEGTMAVAAVRPRLRRSSPVLALLALGTLALGACGDDPSDPSEPAAPATATDPGLRVAREQGCTACHSVDGTGSVGPTWQGLHGSDVELADGSTVTADDEYLVRSIREPNAQIRAGYRGIMPERTIPQEDLDAIVDYLRRIGADA